MKQIITFSAVLFLAFAGIANAQEFDITATETAPAEEAESIKSELSTLYFKNGDYLPGKFVAHDGEGQIRWKTSLFSEPAVFHISGLQHVIYGKIATPEVPDPTPNQQTTNPILGAISSLFKSSNKANNVAPKKVVVNLGARVQTIDGTVLFGDIVSLDDEWIAMRSERHGDFRVKRAVIERIDGSSGNLSTLFDAVSGFQSTSSIGNGRSPKDWNASSGLLTTEQSGANLYLATKHDGPVMVEAVLSAKGKPDFLIALGVSNNSKFVKQGFSVESWGDRLVAHRQGSDELKHAELTTPESTDGTVRLQIFLDPEAGRLLVYSQAKLLGEFVDKDSKTSQKGFLLRNNGSNLTLHRFRAKSWNGRTTPLAPSDQNIVQLAGGDEIQGIVQGINEAGELSIKVDGQDESRTVALKEVDQVVFSSRNSEKADAPNAIEIPEVAVGSVSVVDSEANVRVDYLDGGAVLGKLKRTDDDGLLVDVKNVEKTLRLGWDQIARIQWLAKAGDSQPESAIGLIERTSHRLHGRVVEAGDDGSILWLPVSSTQPVPLNLKTKSKITFDSITASKVDSSLTDELHLTNGDTIPCRLIAIDNESVRVRFADGSDGTVSRDAFKGLRRRPQESYIYRGFKKNESWHVSKNQRNAFSLKDGVLEIKQPLFLSRNVNLPDRACISFDAEWTGDCVLYVGLGADQSFEAVRRMDANVGYSSKLMEAEAKRQRDFYSEIAFTRAGDVLTARGYLRSSGLTGQAFQNNNGVFEVQTARNSPSTLPLSEGSLVNIDIFVDRIRRQFSVVANGKTLHSWKESARIDGGAIYIGFQTQAGSQMNFGRGATVKTAKSTPGHIRMSDLRVARWPGYMPDDRKERLLTRRLGSRPKATTHVLRAFNGDSLRGRLVSVENNSVTFQARLDTITVPLDKIAEIISLKNEEEKKSKFEEFSLELHDGGSIVMKPVQVTEELMIGESPFVGRIALPWKIISRLNVRGSFPRSTSNLVSWSLREPPALPDFVTNPGGSRGSSATKSPLVGKPAPDLDLKLLDGTKVSLADLRGKTVVLDFWATWCGPCIASMPTMMDVTKAYKDKVVFIAVNQQEDADTVKSFLASRNWNELTVAMDDDTVASRSYRVEAIPYSVIIDPEGIVQNVHVGASPDLKDTLTKELDATLAGN